MERRRLKFEKGSMPPSPPVTKAVHKWVGLIGSHSAHCQWSIQCRCNAVQCGQAAAWTSRSLKTVALCNRTFFIFYFKCYVIGSISLIK